MTKANVVRLGAVAILVLGIAIGYVVSQTGIKVTETASAETSAANVNADGVNETSAQATSAEGVAKSTTKDDLSLTPWVDPKDPTIFRMDKSDPTFPDGWRARNDLPKLKREPGPIDIQRYAGGTMHNAFPTFFGLPVAMNTEDLKAGKVEVAILGTTNDMNPVPGARWAPNVLRGFLNSSATYWVSRGDGVQERIMQDGFPMELYTGHSIHELRAVDYGNAAMHQSSGERTTEELRKVIGEIHDADAIPLTVGGAHDNMYGIFLAAVDKFGREGFGVIHFDSHYDGEAEGYGYYVHNGNGLYQGLKRGLYRGDQLVQVGMTSIGVFRADFEYMKKEGMRYHYQAEIEKDGWDAVMRRTLEDVKDIKNLVVTIDLDIMDSAYVPGVGGREPDGPNPAQMMQMVRALAIQNNIVHFDVAEFNPMLDSRSGQTGMVAIKLMTHFMTGLAARKSGVKDPFYYHPEMIDDGK